MCTHAADPSGGIRVGAGPVRQMVVFSANYPRSSPWRASSAGQAVRCKVAVDHEPARQTTEGDAGGISPQRGCAGLPAGRGGAFAATPAGSGGATSPPGRRCAFLEGFSLHTNTWVHENDRVEQKGRVAYYVDRRIEDAAAHLVLRAGRKVRHLSLEPEPQCVRAVDRDGRGEGSLREHFSDLGEKGKK